jgi:putative Mn2+ efflux pump MntP
MLELFVLAIGLAMDATAVAAARGLSAKRVRVVDAVKMSAMFGAAQGLMPLGGWLLGATAGKWIERYDHWIAFGLLGFLGGKMLVDAWRHSDDDDAGASFGFRVLLGLAIATSIDAFAAGITLPLLSTPPAASVAVIGAVTFVTSFAGVYLGRRFGRRLGRNLDVVGGVVLIGLGVEMLVSGLSQLRT